MTVSETPPPAPPVTFRERVAYLGRQAYDYPYTHAVAIGTAYSAVVLLTTLGVNPLGLNSGLGAALSVSAISAASLIVLGLQWHDRIVGSGIEFSGQLLIAAVWAANITIVWTLTGGPQHSMVLPFLLGCAALARSWKLYRRNERVKRALIGRPRHGTC